MTAYSTLPRLRHFTFPYRTNFQLLNILNSTVGEPICVLALLPICLPVGVPGKAVDEGSNAWEGSCLLW